MGAWSCSGVLGALWGYHKAGNGPELGGRTSGQAKKHRAVDLWGSTGLFTFEGKREEQERKEGGKV